MTLLLFDFISRVSGCHFCTLNIWNPYSSFNRSAALPNFFFCHSQVVSLATLWCPHLSHCWRDCPGRSGCEYCGISWDSFPPRWYRLYVMFQYAQPSVHKEKIGLVKTRIIYYYSAWRRKRVLTHVTTGMNCEGMVLREVKHERIPII